MNFIESAVALNCQGKQLLALLAAPEQPARVGVVVIVGGPQYRVGSHRQFLLLSRRLAQAGYAVLRFDCRGMGDSEGLPLGFEQIDDDVKAAIDALQVQVPTVQHVVLWGLCDGASAALLYCQATQDVRVRGLCLLNPWVRSAASLARTQVKHYYLQRLRQKAFWLKFLSGKVAWQALSGLLHSLSLALGPPVRNTTQASFQDRMAAAWRGFEGDILLLLSGNDYTAKEFVEHASTDAAWSGALSRHRLSTQHLAGVDHTCSGLDARQRVEDHTLTWLSECGSLNP